MYGYAGLALVTGVYALYWGISTGSFFTKDAQQYTFIGRVGDGRATFVDSLCILFGMACVSGIYESAQAWRKYALLSNPHSSSAQLTQTAREVLQRRMTNIGIEPGICNTRSSLQLFNKKTGCIPIPWEIRKPLFFQQVLSGMYSEYPWSLQVKN